MSTKPWEDRVHLVANHGEKAAMVEELDELRQENARLRAEVDQWKVDFTEVLTDTKRLRDVLALCLSSLQNAWGCIENSTEQEDAKIEIGLDAARAALGES